MLARLAWMLASALASAPLRAIDLATAAPPVEIDDLKLTSGPRTLVLPPGHWLLLDLTHESVSSGASGATVADNATFAQVEDGKLALGGRLFILRNDALAFGWSFSPCVSAEDIYLRDRAPNIRQPDCLTVYSRRRGVVGANANVQLSHKTTEWLAAHRIETPEYAVVITYSRYATNTFGALSLTIPSDRFDSDGAAISWSETLRTALKRLFEHREDAGRFPALPPPAAAQSQPEAEASPSSP